MRTIISIQGAMASGKTTLAQALKDAYPELHIYYENPYPIVQKRKELGLDIRTEDGFVENQRLFIQAEIERFLHFPDGHIILDRGPEDLEFYTLHYPQVHGHDWDMESRLKTELEALRECRSDQILYLRASNQLLQTRRDADQTRTRQSFEQHQPLWALEENWYKQFPVYSIDTTAKTPEQVRQAAIHQLSVTGILGRGSEI
ncbi:AAA family ATPase [Exiguobacterium sp. TBG-PICH-001]|uniref:AAA family ATPase n=1 Tax=Exiguobacterium abrahamii TaxID=2785532 RepID=UPI0018A74D36|nr:AAA family ATPase [Exiguobacterium sp. TBG-PICH-001]MBF8153220.1 AAA family ATPase [Exiguobacterium sp. TBG-PICH-001]